MNLKDLNKKLTIDENGGAGSKILVAVVIIAMIGGGIYAFFGSQSTVEINVYSTHILADTDVTVYVDDKNIGTYHVNNLSGIKITHSYRFSGFDDSKLINVKAIATGGYLGAQGDQKLITVHDGQTSKVNLYV